MIYTYTENTNIFGKQGSYKVSQYFGEDVPADFKKYIGKECVSKGYSAIIIGIEQNEVYFDDYFIVYVPGLTDVVFELCNDAEFTKTIKL